MADSKWISGLTGNMPALDAARHVLRIRISAIRQHLEPAVRLADKDIEHVHQLRVSTRRAGAALRIFAAFLSDKSYTRARKRLRKLRRAAGAARDWDVFLETINERRDKANARQKSGIDLLVGLANGQRITAQVHLAEEVTDPKLDIDALLAETVSALRIPEGPFQTATLRSVAAPMLTRLVGELHQAATENLHDYEHLHRVRILGKNIRYAMEVFAVGFPPAFRAKHYVEIEAMQDILGFANDSFVAGHRLETIRDHLLATQPGWKRYQPGVASILDFHAKRLVAQREQFLNWWQRWTGSGAETRLLRMLAD